jgi:hypothetical protein
MAKDGIWKVVGKAFKSEYSTKFGGINLAGLILTALIVWEIEKSNTIECVFRFILAFWHRDSDWNVPDPPPPMLLVLLIPLVLFLCLGLLIWREDRRSGQRKHRKKK